MLEMKPYLLNAVYRFIADKGEIPFMTVVADERCTLPMEFAKDVRLPNDDIVKAITLNLSMNATKNLSIPEDGHYLTFGATFGGRHMDVVVPYDCILHMYPKGKIDQGIGFEYIEPEDSQIPTEPESKPETKKPTLSVVK